MNILTKSRFRLVRTTQWVGVVKIYQDRLTGQHIAVSRASTLDRGDETMAFLFDNVTDRVTDWHEIFVRYGVTHTDLVRELEEKLTEDPGFIIRN